LKKLILILFLTGLTFGQSNLLLLMSSDVVIVPDEMETTRYLASLTTPLSDSQEVNINNLIAMLKDSLNIDSLPQVFDAIYLFANETSEAGLKNIVKRSFDGTLAGTSNPTFQAWRGFGDDPSIGGYVNSNFTPSTEGVAYTLNSSSFGVYSRVDHLGTGLVEMGTYSGTNTRSRIYLLASANTVTYSIQDASADFSVANSNTSGLFVVSRTGETAKAVYRNGLSLGTDATASGGLSAQKFYIMAWNNNGTAAGMTPRQIAIAFIGKGFTPTEVRMINNCFEVYLDGIGAGVQ